MSSDHNHINTTEGIEDVELEDEQLEEKSYEELVKERRTNTQEAVRQYREAVSSAGEGDSSNELEKSDTEAAGGSNGVEFGPAQTDGEIIKRTGIARLGVDTTDEDDEAMRDLIKQARHDEVQIGFENESSGDPAFDAIQKGTSSVRESFERDIPLTQLPSDEQASTLAKEAAEDIDLETLVKNAADLPKSPGAVREQVYERVYTDITKFVRTIYSEAEVDKDVLNTVREKIATDAARRAMVRRKANEDGVTVDSTEYEVSEDGEEAVENETQEEATDGGETDAPKTEDDSKDVDLSDDDMDLQN